MVDSTVYPGERRKAFKVIWEIDNTMQEFEEEELRPHLVVASRPERKEVIDGLVPAFDYLESRITGTCEISQYSCAQMYEVCSANTY